ncbi:F-box protein: endocytic membrane traffic, recycling ReCYcling 1, partial [Podochytrium sp. JEL0797]
MLSKKKAAAPPKAIPTLPTLPPDLVSRVFLFLPVVDLARVAQTSRRMKILAYSDDVYVFKLRVLCVTGVDPSSEGGEDDDADAGLQRLAARLKQLPGATLASAKYLETGSLFGGVGVSNNVSNSVSNSVSGAASVAVSVASVSVLGGEASLPQKDDNDPTQKDSATDTSAPPGVLAALSLADETLPPAPTTTTTTTSTDTPKISSALPAMKKSTLVVGAGGLRAAHANAKASSGSASPLIGAGKRSKAPSVSRTASPASSSAVFYAHLRGLRPREAFKRVFVELSPYYLDFRSHAKDSKVFRDNKDMVHVAVLLRRIARFASAKLIEDTDDIDFALETTIEWYESMLLGQFERAYDAKQINEMKRNATACFELNGGASCVQLFCAKNPIFFDHTFNPSLVASKLPSLVTSTAEARGYALADDFAQFMDHTLASCTLQSTIVAQVFHPQMDAMTTFVSKVFDDSISEYLVAVLTVARDGEGVAIYLHTLATSVHSCNQFLGFVAAADARVVVRTEFIREAMKRIFKRDWDAYMDVEMDYLGKKVESELRKWNTRKARSTPAGSPSQPASYLTDAEKAMAHKREVMTIFKKVLFAPVALGKSVGNALMGTSSKSRGQHESLLGSDSGEGMAFPETAAGGSSGGGGGGGGAFHKDPVSSYHLDDGSLGSLVSLELCLNLMHMSKESLGRVLVITSAIEASMLKVNAGRVFVRLLQAIGEGHMNPAFASAISRLESSKPVDNWSEKAVNIDSLQFFELVHIADLVHQMLDVYFAEDVRPWIDENDFLSDVMIEKKSFDRHSDDNVAHGMDKAIQVLVNQVDHILDTQQKPADYNPLNDDGVYDFRPTQACLDVIACLNAHTRLLNGVTNKDTLEVFFGEVGVRLFNVICKNLKKQQ